MIDIGQKVRFVPCWDKKAYDIAEEFRTKSVTGKVIYIDRAHRKFTVKYDCGGTVQKETFKFADIDKDIFILRGGRYGS